MVRKKQRSAIGRFFYRLRYRIGEHMLRCFIKVLPLIPYWLALAVTRFMARVSFALLWRFRRRMEENVAALLSQEIPDAAERTNLVWRAWANFARVVLDTAEAIHFSRARMLSTVTLEGEEHLKRALDQGRGVLALSAHLGGFTMIGPRLAAAGFPFSVVVKQPADARFAVLSTIIVPRPVFTRSRRSRAARRRAAFFKRCAKIALFWSLPTSLNRVTSWSISWD